MERGKVVGLGETTRPARRLQPLVLRDAVGEVRDGTEQRQSLADFGLGEASELYDQLSRLELLHLSRHESRREGSCVRSKGRRVVRARP